MADSQTHQYKFINNHVEVFEAEALGSDTPNNNNSNDCADILGCENAPDFRAIFLLSKNT